MKEWPLFEQVAAEVQAGRRSPAQLGALLDQLQQLLDQYSEVDESIMGACERCLGELREQPSSTMRGRELDIACRLLANSLVPGKIDCPAWPALPALVEALQQARFGFEALVEAEMRNLRRTAALPFKVEAYRHTLLALARILEAILQGALSPQQGAEQLLELRERLDRLHQDENEARYASEPTSWPSLNAVIQLGRMVVGGQALAASLETLINGLLDSVDELEQASQDLVASFGEESAQGSAHAGALASQLRHHLHALNQASLKILMHVEHGQSLAPHWPAYEAVGLAAAQAVQDFLHANEEIGKTPCIRCGTPNPRERSHCLKCQAILPRQAQTHEGYSVAEGEANEAGSIGDQLSPLLVAIDDALVDRETLPHMDNLLAEFEQRFLKAQQVSSQLPAGSAEAVAFEQVMGMTAEGIECLKEGSHQALTEGRQLLVAANDLAQSHLQEG